MNFKYKAGVLFASFALVLTAGFVPAYAGNRSNDFSTEEIQKNDDGSWTWEGKPIVIHLPDGNEWNTDDVKWPWQNDKEEEQSDDRGGDDWEDPSDENNYWNDDEDSTDEESDEEENLSEFDLDLSGDEEVPGPGDEDGEGWANVRLLSDQKLVCVDMEVSNIELPATDAHIHKAVEDASGPAVLALPIPNEEGDAYGCVKATDAQITDMMDNPEMFYVNVHSSDHPDGAIRGQFAYSDEE